MALATDTVFEIRPGGNDTNGGGFVPGSSGTDFSQQDAPQYSVTDGVTAGTTTITSASANFGTDVVGNTVYVEGGTGAVSGNWYRITARLNSTTIQVDRSTGLTSGTGVTLKIGGGLATPGGLGYLLATASSANGMSAWIKSGTYTLANATTNTPGGPLSLPTVRFVLSGYTTTRGDRVTRPVLHAGVQTSVALLSLANVSTVSPVRVRWLEVDGNSGTGNVGFSGASSSRNSTDLCIARNCTAGFATIAHVMNCTALSCGDGFSIINDAVSCSAYLCSGNGFIGIIESCRNCLAAGNGIDGISTAPNATGRCDGCISVGNARHGFAINNQSSQQVAQNCLAASNGGYGFVGITGTTVQSLGAQTMLVRCAGYSNTSGRINATPEVDSEPITLTADPFVDSANGDYNINNVAGGGAVLRAVQVAL